MQVHITLFLGEKRQGLFIRAGTFIRINMVLVSFSPRPDNNCVHGEILPIILGFAKQGLISTTRTIQSMV